MLFKEERILLNSTDLAKKHYLHFPDISEMLSAVCQKNELRLGLIVQKFPLACFYPTDSRLGSRLAWWSDSFDKRPKQLT